MTDEKMVEKIQKLLAKAERAATAEEAEAFSAKAQELMTKWAIDELTVAAARGRKIEDKIVTKHVKLSGTYTREDYRMYDRVGQANDVRVAYYGYTTSKYAVLVGYSNDVTNVELLTTSLMIQCTRDANRATKREPMWPTMTPTEKYVWRRSFKEDFAITVGHRLEEARRRVVADTHDDSLVPMLRDKASAVDEYCEELGWQTTRARARKFDARGGAAGVAAGRQADVGAPRVGNGTRGALGR